MTYHEVLVYKPAICYPEPIKASKFKGMLLNTCFVRIMLQATEGK
jgi:hypothetical protein